MTNDALQRLSSDDLRAATRALVGTSCQIEADLLAHLAEIDERKLYNAWSFPSMFAFCLEELGFSEDAAYYRITVARAARRFPAILEAVRSGRVHLAGLRLVVPHLTEQNHREVLARAAGKSKRAIEELAACLAPRPPVPATIRVVPPVPPLIASPVLGGGSAALRASMPQPAGDRRPVIEPLSGETFRIEFTASRGFRDKLRQAQDLLQHRVPDRDMAEVLERALDVLIKQVTKERFAIGRKERPAAPHDETEPSERGASVASSRHVPDAIKRLVYERDGGRCTFTDDQGRRCTATSALEFEHVEGFACTHQHDPDKIRLLCRWHNQYAAEQLYGREFMERARAGTEPTRPGASSPPLRE